AVAALVTTCMRRASAARRHFVWYVAISGCLALTVLQTVVPPIALRVSATSQSGRVLSALLPADAELGSVSRSETLRLELGSVSRSETLRRTADGATATSRDGIIPVGATSELEITIWQRALTAIENVPLAAVLIALWSVGAIVVLLRLTVAHIQLSWLVRTSRDVTDAVWQMQFTQASAQLQTARSVRLLAHASVTTPFTAGFFQPAIIVPESSASWDASRRQAVLMHELAHVARGDYFALIVATVTCALFWFHPGVWYAARKMRNESESAADDCVVTRGVPAVQYATHLLALADRTHATNLTPQIALGMARISQLEWRLRAMLDERRSRVAVSRLARRVSGVAALVVLAPLAGLRAEARSLGSSDRLGSDPIKPAGSSAQLGSDPIKRDPIKRDPIKRAVATTPIESVKQSNVELPDTELLAASVPEVRSIADTIFDKTVAVIDTVALAMKWETGGHLTINQWDEPSFRLRAAFGGTRAALGRVTLEHRADSVIVHSYFTDGSTGPYKDALFEIWVPRRARTNNFGSWTGTGSWSINRRSPSAAAPEYFEFSIPKAEPKPTAIPSTFPFQSRRRNTIALVSVW
ncbi:MAG: M56 family metallopeptidase, partial [Gemmatimonadaceae bacterium]